MVEPAPKALCTFTAAKECIQFLSFDHIRMGSYDTEPNLDTSVSFGDWRDQLVKDGYVVLKGVISQDKAKSYLDSMFDWLESFPYGFKKDDPSTWGPEHLPAHIKYFTCRDLYLGT